MAWKHAEIEYNDYVWICAVNAMWMISNDYQDGETLSV